MSESSGNLAKRPSKRSVSNAELERWQMEEVNKGLLEADRGEFASDEEVANVIRKFVRNL